MQQRFGNWIALVTIVIVAWVGSALAQDAASPSDSKELRFQFMAHDFIVDGLEQEVYLKLDRFTGETWRFHASNPRWMLVPETSNGIALEAGNQSRYELLPHNYFDQSGDPQELYIRADMVTGNTWVYRGANGMWHEVGQESPPMQQGPSTLSTPEAPATLQVQ
jgi:hypothetical protein